jgi:hypothetical protein
MSTTVVVVEVVEHRAQTLMKLTVVVDPVAVLWVDPVVD